MVMAHAHGRAGAAVLAFALLSGCAPSHAGGAHDGGRIDRTPLAVVPQPRSVRFEPGRYAWPFRVRIGTRTAADRGIAGLLRTYLAENGVAAADVGAAANPDVLVRAEDGYDGRLGDEGYVLHAGSRGVTLRANTRRGLFYALQTLEQITARSRGSLLSRAVTISDRPAYRWRGIHLDVARHFFPVETIERYIDVAARFKLNVLHWHLTDDEAWRLENRRYPALSAGRERYSAADVRRVVAYAARRSMTVVPEIEMPAHAGAALRGYPRLACGHGTLCTTGAGLAFARDVLGDAMAEFPSSYIHAGGDEVPAAVVPAQSAFTRELERFVAARARRLIVWDDALDPALSRNTVVMVWTSRERAAQALRRGHDVVLASGALYFDAAQGDAAQEPHATPHMATLEQVYDYGMTPAGIGPRDAVHILGAQANVWTERIATPERLFSMTLPRELALAEIVWTPRERKDWTSFLARLPAQLAWLDAHGYAFRIPNASFAVTGGRIAFEAVPGEVQTVRATADAPSATIALSVPLAGAVIRYTIDGSAPSPSSRRYAAPFTVALRAAPVRVRAAAFLRGRAGAVTECVLARGSLATVRARRGASASWSALVSP